MKYITIKYSLIFNLIMLSFYSHNEAARYFKIDVRTVKKKLYNIEYIIDKVLNINPQIKLKQCKVCGDIHPSSKMQHLNCPKCKRVVKQGSPRICKFCNSHSVGDNLVNNHSICHNCSKLNLGRKSQAAQASTNYKGINNPNYIHGNSKIKMWQDSRWVKLKKRLF